MNIIPKEKTNNFELSTLIYKALTHPARLEILEILREGEHCVCHMEAYLGYRQAYISQQLSVLREAGLIQDRRDGWNIFYQVTDRRIYEVLDAMSAITGKKETILRTTKKVCDCPKCSSKSLLGQE